MITTGTAFFWLGIRQIITILPGLLAPFLLFCRSKSRGSHCKYRLHPGGQVNLPIDKRVSLTFHGPLCNIRKVVGLKHRLVMLRFCAWDIEFLHRNGGAAVGRSSYLRARTTVKVHVVVMIDDCATWGLPTGGETQCAR